MSASTRRPSSSRPRPLLLPLIAVTWALSVWPAFAQALTGAVFAVVKDESGAVIAGARATIASPSLIGGPSVMIADQAGQLRFLLLAPGLYVLDIVHPGFTSYHEEGLRVGVGQTIERTAILKIPRLTAPMVQVEGRGSRLDARNPGLSTILTPGTLPTRRVLFDPVRSAPGVSPTSPSGGSTWSGLSTTISVHGSGTNENHFLIDGMNITCPCNGVARAEPGLDFIREIQVQSAGASVEFGAVQGAVVNMVTRQGGNNFEYDASYYGQSSSLTSQPVRLRIPNSTRESGYARARYQDLTTNLGGPVLRDRLWFFGGYQYLRDYDSQPGVDPDYPRTYEQNKAFGKLNWKLGPGWQLLQSFHYERWVNPDPPTSTTPFEVTVRRRASVPTITAGHLTHSVSANTVWDVRAGYFGYWQKTPPSTGVLTVPNRQDTGTGIASGGPANTGALTITRTTMKATLSHFRRGWGAEHLWKVGTQFERGGHHAANIIPTSVRFVDNNGVPVTSVSRAPSGGGAQALTLSAFANDAITLGGRLTLNVGVRFDHARAISQDVFRLDLEGNETREVEPGLGTLYTWNIVSPRLGLTMRLTDDGRTMVRASYGRFSAGVMTGELEQFHPAATATTTRTFDATTGTYTRPITVDPRFNLLLDANIRVPRTDELSIGVDREIGQSLVLTTAYVRKDGRHFIGWTDAAGVYIDQTRTVDGRSVAVRALDTSVTPTSARRFLLTNPDGYSLTYNGLVISLEKRRSRGWQASGSYTLSKAHGLLPSSGASAAGAQVSTISPPGLLTFGRDPNDLTNARGRLPNDRPHMFRMVGSVDIPKTGVVLTSSLQHYTGKPWTATGFVSLPQSPQQRILLEPAGSRRLASQTLLDVRLSRAVRIGGLGRADLRLDLLNLLNDTAAEGIVTDNIVSTSFGQPTLFMDPRRAMLSVRLTVGR